MPKISEEQQERRRQQIIEAARECFTAQGFHNTSMQDIFQASGLSAGAVYRYFPSKHELVKAIAADSLNAALAALSSAGTDSRSMADSVAALGGMFATDGTLAGIRPMIMQIWAEAPRDPSIAAVSREVLSYLIGRIEGVLPPGTPPEAARLLMATIQGFLIQSLVFQDVTTDMVSKAAAAVFREPGMGR